MISSKPQWEIKLDKILEQGINTEKLNKLVNIKLEELYDLKCKVSVIDTDNACLSCFESNNEFEIILDYEKIRLDDKDNPTTLQWMLTIIDIDGCIHKVDEQMKILNEVEKIALKNEFDIVQYITNLNIPSSISLTNNGYTLVEETNENDESHTCSFFKSVRF